ncbi:MAG: Ig-like domain-containing protein [Lachnospiraceae bacterium]|nr:Ig-like domain-containing protein [Lachnospiraceae bacterium]
MKLHFKGIISFALSICLVFSGILGAFSQSKNASAKIRISAKKATIYVGKYKQLKLKGLSKKKQKKVKWKSRNKKVVKVGKHGKIKGVKKGRAYVIATFKKKKYKCLVTVKKKATASASASPQSSSAAASASPGTSASPGSSSNPSESSSPEASSSPDDGNNEIINSNSKTLSVSTMQVVMGEYYSDTRSRLGDPVRTAKSAYGTDLYVFRKGSSTNYSAILYVLVKDSKVVGAYTMSAYANYANIAQSGMSESQLSSNGFYQNTNSGMEGLYYYEEDGCFIEAYVDPKNTKKVCAIRCYTNDFDFDTMMRSDYNTENYKSLDSVTYNGASLYVSDEYDKEVVELMSAYRLAVGLSAFTVYEGCGREMAEIGASKGYSSASDYSDDEKSVMKTAVKKAGSGQISTSLRSVYSGDTYSDPFTVVTNWAELDATYPSLIDSTFNCIMGGFAYSPTYENSFTYVVLWGATKGDLA